MISFRATSTTWITTIAVPVAISIVYANGRSVCLRITERLAYHSTEASGRKEFGIVGTSFTSFSCL